MDTPIGIDIEHKIQRKHLDKIAYRFFSAYDYNQLKLLNEKEKFHTFFNIWVRNEATLKAFGKQLQTHPCSHYNFSINQQLGLPDIIKSKKIQSCTTSYLLLYSNFASAVVIAGHNKHIIVKKYTHGMSRRELTS